MNRKKIVTALITVMLTFTGGTFPVNASGSATVNILVNASNGAKLSGVEISCKSTAPQIPGGYPPAPIFSYLTTGSNGSATWTINVNDGYSYKCDPRTGVAYINNTCYSFGAASPSGSYSLSAGEVKTISIPASLAPGFCTYYGEGSDSSSTTSTIEPDTTTSSSDSDPVIEYAPIAEIALPEIFTRNSSSTSDLSELTKEAASNYKNLVLEISGIAKIEFHEELDLSSKEIADKFKNLDKYISMETGKVSVNSDKLPELNKKSRIVLFAINLTNDKNITIKKEGEIDLDIGKTAIYDKNNKSLSFEVDGFSTYEIVPYVEITSNDSSDKSIYTLKGSVNDLDSEIEIYLNGELISEEIPIDDEGSFSHEIELSEGENEVKANVKGVSGIIEENTITVQYNTSSHNKIDNSTIIGVVVLVGAMLIISGIVYYYSVKKKKKFSNTTVRS